MNKHEKIDLNLNDLCNLIALEVKDGDPKVAKRYLKATYKVILQQLQLNKRILFYGFGAFELVERKSGERLVNDLNNEENTDDEMFKTLVYITPRNQVRFRPSQILDTNVNENDFNLSFSIKKKKAKRKKTFNEGIVDLINTAERRSGNKWRNN